LSDGYYQTNSYIFILAIYSSISRSFCRQVKPEVYTSIKNISIKMISILQLIFYNNNFLAPRSLAIAAQLIKL